MSFLRRCSLPLGLDLCCEREQSRWPRFRPLRAPLPSSLRLSSLDPRTCPLPLPSSCRLRGTCTSSLRRSLRSPSFLLPLRCWGARRSLRSLLSSILVVASLLVVPVGSSQFVFLS